MFDKIPIIFVQGIGRTGFDLLRTLLDGHKQILILPFSDKFTTIWQNHKLNKNTSLDKLVEIFLYNSKIFRFKKQIVSSLDFNHDYSMVDWNLYEKYFREFISNNKTSSRYVRLAIYFAFAKSIKKDIDSLKVIVADAFYTDQTNFILEDFPNARFLHLIKDHRSNFLSLKSYYHKVHGTLYPLNGNIRNMPFHILYDCMFPIMKMLHRNKIKLGNKLKILKYEQLLENPEITMQDISNWLGIEYSKQLLLTTRIGKKAISSSAFNNKGVSGINPEFSNRWIKDLPPFEVRMIEYLFKESIENLGYKIVYKNTVKNIFLGIVSCIIPWKGEILPHSDILKEKKIGRSRYVLWRYTKYFIYLINNMIRFNTSRLKIFFLISKNEYKMLRLNLDEYFKKDKE